MIRLFLIGILIYFFSKIVKSLFSGAQSSNVSSQFKQTAKQTPPPFDPSQIEDIDYEEIKEDE